MSELRRKGENKIEKWVELLFSLHGKWKSDDRSRRFPISEKVWFLYPYALSERSSWLKCQVHRKLQLNGLFVHNWRLVDRTPHQSYSIQIRAHNQTPTQIQNMISNVILTMKIQLRSCTNGHRVKQIIQVIHRLPWKPFWAHPIIMHQTYRAKIAAASVRAVYHRQTRALAQQQLRRVCRSAKLTSRNTEAHATSFWPHAQMLYPNQMK